MKTNNTKKVTKENKSEMGMNRNEFFEYKKQRCMDLARKGATVGEIAKDLAMTEKEMYAFLSRNFGGIRQMRESVKAGFGVPQLAMAGMSVGSSVVDMKKEKKSNNSGSVTGIFSSALESEKKKIIDKFRKEMELEIKSVISDVELSLSQVKNEVLTKFKDSVMKDLTEIANGF